MVQLKSKENQKEIENYLNINLKNIAFKLLDKQLDYLSIFGCDNNQDIEFSFYECNNYDLISFKFIYNDIIIIMDDYNIEDNDDEIIIALTLKNTDSAILIQKNNKKTDILITDEFQQPLNDCGSYQFFLSDKIMISDIKDITCTDDDKKILNFFIKYFSNYKKEVENAKKLLKYYEKCNEEYSLDEFVKYWNLI